MQNNLFFTVNRKIRANGFVTVHIKCIKFELIKHIIIMYKLLLNCFMVIFQRIQNKKVDLYMYSQLYFYVLQVDCKNLQATKKLV